MAVHPNGLGPKEAGKAWYSCDNIRATNPTIILLLLVFLLLKKEEYLRKKPKMKWKEIQKEV